MKPILSIIIPSYNTKELLQQCLESVYRQKATFEFEVIVVDNASQDRSCSMIKSKFPKVKLIQNKKNLGYAKANNQAFKIAEGEYFLLLNSDTILLEKTIKKAVSFLDGNNIDILGCQLLNKDKSIQPSAGFFPDIIRVFYWMFFIDELPFLKRIIKPYQQSRKDFYQKTRKVDWASGAFLLFRRKVIDTIGGFDNDFFMYCEEVELCFRAEKKDFQVWFYPQSKIIHLKSKSSEKGFQQSVLAEYKGIKKFYKKHKPDWQMFLLKLFLKSGAVIRILFFGILMGNKSKKEVYEKAFRLV